MLPYRLNREYDMDTQTPLRELADLTHEETPENALNQHYAKLVAALEELGFAEPGEATAGPLNERPEFIATREGKQVCICLPPMADHPLRLSALSDAQCNCCDEHYPACDVYYASLFIAPSQGSEGTRKLCLLGPVCVREGLRWQTQEPSRCQYLPMARRTVRDRYSPIFGGCVLFKLERCIIPHVLEHGQLPRFSVQGLFEDRPQGEAGLYALMSGEPPTHFMLVATGAEGHEFRRPFFFYGERPHAELELLHGEGTPEWLEKTGRRICAESLEHTLYPGALPAGRHYMCTLSMVADRCRPLQRELRISSGPLRDQVRRDYARVHGEEPPEDFTLQVNTQELRTWFQEPHHPYTELCGKVVRAERTQVDGQPAALLSVLPISQNDELEVQVFVGMGVGLSSLPEPGDVVECAGFLYASPDSVLETAESWQDSGEVAAMQSARETAAHAMEAYERYAPYSLAMGVAAAAFAGAGYMPVAAPITHTRDAASLVVQNDAGERCLIFADTVLHGAQPAYHYTDEQRSAILERARAADEQAPLRAYHCVVHLQRDSRGEQYSVQMDVSPECPALRPEQMICDAAQFAPPGPPLTEEDACRLACNAVCTQDWVPFARAAAEDMTYTSLVNDTHTYGKSDFIRYMSERKQLWEKQQGWPGMSMDTGSVLYRGVRRPCFMITCYGRRIGAAVFTLRHGLIAGMETVPLEINETFEPDAECAQPPEVFHPLRGHLTPHPASATPLQRFAGAFLRECMMHKTGLRGDERSFNRGSDGARWLKVARNEPSFCDLAFAHAGRVYAVCAVEVPTHPENGGSIEDIAAAHPELAALLAEAETHGFVPCIFPAQRGHTPSTATSWNLWHARTRQPVIPEAEPATPEGTLPSAWEVLCATLTELSERIRRTGGHVLAYHDTLALAPHLWYRDAAGRLCWLLVRPHVKPEPDTPADYAEKRAVALTPGSDGYVVDATAYGSAQAAPARRGEPLYLRISTPRPAEA